MKFLKYVHSLMFKNILLGILMYVSTNSVIQNKKKLIISVGKLKENAISISKIQ